MKEQLLTEKRTNKKELTKIFNEHFNLKYHRAFNKNWVSIIGEPYSAEDFEKNLKEFVMKANIKICEDIGLKLWNKKYIKKPTKVTFKKSDGSKVSFRAVKIVKRSKNV